MNCQLQAMNLAGSACQPRKAHTANNRHRIHHHHTTPKALHVTAPIQWVHEMLQEIHAIHPLHRANVWVHRRYWAHADRWASTGAVVAAFTLASLLACALYLLLSVTQVTDYTTGAWPLFG